MTIFVLKRDDKLQLTNVCTTLSFPIPVDNVQHQLVGLSRVIRVSRLSRIRVSVRIRVRFSFGDVTLQEIRCFVLPCITDFSDSTHGLKAHKPTERRRTVHGCCRETALVVHVHQVRVPTHVKGSSIFWEFASDSYDVGFGVYFEWNVDPPTQVTVQMSESSDDDDDLDDEYADG